MFVEVNLNPADHFDAEDCTIRAIALATGQDWDTVYAGLVAEGFKQKYKWDKNPVWWQYLWDLGWRRHWLPDTCPLCYSLADFAAEHRSGSYLVGGDGHVVAVKDGNYYDLRDSGGMTALYYWSKEE